MHPSFYDLHLTYFQGFARISCMPEEGLETPDTRIMIPLPAFGEIRIR